MLWWSSLCVLAVIAVAYCQPSAPSRAPQDYRITLRFPDNCQVSACDLFVGIDTNQGDAAFLDVYMEGNANGWLAVGFSTTQSMFDADVLACNINSNSGVVEVLDTWNPAFPTRSNIVDAEQDVTPFTATSDAGRITCTFARSILGSNVGTRDLDLNAPYFILYGVGPNPAPGMLTSHAFGSELPRLSANMINPMADMVGVGVRAAVGLPPNVTLPERGPQDYRITARIPGGCAPPSCEVFVGIDTNAGDEEFLDVYIEGSANGWLAVGFSRTRNMFDADVLACNLNPATNMVEVLDTWNVASPGRNNIRDDTEDIGVFSSTRENGRITCIFVRSILGTDVGTADLNLNEPYFILYGQSPSSASGLLVRHATGAGNPLVSDSQYNPQNDTADISNDNSVRFMLTRAHGIIMIIAWPLMAVTAIFFAAWMRPALPNGEWFQVHRAFMIGSLVLGIVGFILIFAAQYDRNTPGLISLGAGAERETAHFAIGILVMALQIANPIIAIFRCHPGTPRRWIFNLVHGTLIGLGAEILALINVGIGLALFSEGFSRFTDLTIFYVYLAYIVFFIATILVLFLLYTVLAFISDDDDRAKLAPSLVKPLIGSGSGQNEKNNSQGVELAVPGEKPPSDPAADSPKLPSRDAPLRWVTLAVFAGVTIPIMLVLIILVAIPQ